MKTCFILFLLLINIALFAQDKANIVGIVYDSTAKPLANVAVLLMKEKVLITGAYTDVNGEYFVENLDTGLYQIEIHTLNDSAFVENLPLLANKTCHLYTGFKAIPEIKLSGIEINGIKRPPFGYCCRSYCYYYTDDMRFRFADRRLIAPARFMPQVYVPIR